MTEPLIWFLGQLARTGQSDIKQPTAGRKKERERGRHEERRKNGQGERGKM